MGKYTEVKSKYIRSKLKKADWNKDKEHIDNLIFLEKSILKGVFGSGANIILYNLKEKYSDEYLKILKELNPKKFKENEKKNNKEIAKYLKFIKDFNKKEREEKRREKEDWDNAKKR